MASSTYLEKWHYYLTCGLLLAMFSTKPVVCGTLSDTQTLIEDLLTDYNIDVRPALDQAECTNVTVDLRIMSIQEVDEVKELFAFVAGLIVLWTDPRMSWDPSLYGDIEQITVSYSKVWVPEVVLTNPSERIDTLGQKWQRVRYGADGSAMWVPGNYFKTDCPIGAYKFPFDTQTCTVAFAAISYSKAELTLFPISDKVILTMFSGDGLWDIKNTETTSGLFANFSSTVEFILHLTRKPNFVIINILTPVMSLCVLSSFAFLLVPESGERVSFCITVFLSISVFLTMISGILPQTSEPVPVISYALMLNAMLSSTSTIVVILNLRLYHRENQHDVPQWLQRLYIKGACIQWRRNKVQEIDRADNDAKEEPRASPTFLKIGEKDEMPGFRKLSVADASVDVTWKAISAMVDNISFVVFSFAGFVIFAVFNFRTLI